ncbi:MAG TPA: transglycosylase SLT domain-containing protein [Silvibacterium sp.]|nr:transglycosylase SLT domain-containing protein [Silvibacterium sp.]
MVVQRLSAALVSILLTTGLSLLSRIHPAASQQTSAAQQPSSARQRDQQLIQNVENAYQNGLSNYRDGHLAAAKSNFDYAVDLMLSSGIDLNADPELKDEFDHIVDAVNTLEMDALKSGTGLAEPAEPTPVDVANAATFTVDPTIRAEAEASLKNTQSDIPLVINDYVASYINFFLKSRAGRATIVASLNRAGRYKDMIERILREEGVPQDLIYQAVAESGFRPQAVNPKSGAGGMWQFMPWGVYGLERTGWYDERFDPEKATRAYANEMKKAYNQLGDWYLAMAAYDWGTGNIQRAVQRTGYADFWELYRRNNLPTETKNYVPIILAVTILAKNAKQYGLDDLTPDPPLLTDSVRTTYSVDLRLVADVTGAPIQEIASLNPSLLRGATPPDEEFDLHLPVGTKDLYEKRIAEIPEDKRRYWRYHKLAPGEAIAEVARSYRVSVSEIAFVNQLSSTDDLAGIDALVIPVAPASLPSSARNAIYRTRKGDTLITVADRFGVTVDQLKRWNHLKTTALTPGHSLYVAEPAHIPESSRKGRKANAASHQSPSHHAAAQPLQHPAKANTGSQSLRRTSAAVTSHN